MWKDRIAANGKSVSRLGQLANALKFFGRAQSKAKLFEGAQSNCSQVVEIRREILLMATKKDLVRVSLSRDLNRWAAALIENGERQKRRTVYEESLAMRRAMLAADPRNPVLLQGMGFVLSTLADQDVLDEDHEQALARHQEALEFRSLRRDLLGKTPATMTAVLSSHANLAAVLCRMGAQEQGIQQLDKARAVLAEALEKWPNLDPEGEAEKQLVEVEASCQ